MKLRTKLAIRRDEIAEIMEICFRIDDVGRVMFPVARRRPHSERISSDSQGQ